MTSCTGLSVNLIVAIIIITFCSAFQFGYSVGVLNQPHQYIRGFYRSSYEHRSNSTMKESTITVLFSVTSALLDAGLIIGSLVGGFVVDRLGRLGGIMFSQVPWMLELV